MQIPDIVPTELAYFDPGDGRRIAFRIFAPSGPAAASHCLTESAAAFFSAWRTGIDTAVSMVTPFLRMLA